MDADGKGKELTVIDNLALIEAAQVHLILDAKRFFLDRIGRFRDRFVSCCFLLLQSRVRSV